MSAAQLIDQEVSNIYGPVYWGCIVSTALIGTTLMQGSTYFSRNSGAMILKLLVSTLLLLDIAESAFMAYTIYYFFVLNFENAEVFFATIPVSWILEGLVTAAVTFIVQVFFATRIYLVTRKCVESYSWYKISPALIVVIALGSLASTIACNTLLAMNNSREVTSKSVEITRCFGEGLAALSDIMATCTLCFIIASGDSQRYISVPYVSRSQNFLDRKQSPFRRLFFFLLTRGILVTFIQLGTLVAYLVAISHLYWMPLQLCKSKLYTNTLLAILNSSAEKPQTTRNISAAQFRPSLIFIPDITDGSASRPQSPRMDIEARDRISGIDAPNLDDDASGHRPMVGDSAV